MTAGLIAGDRDGMGARVSRIVYRSTESLKLNPKNPKTHTKKQVGQIAQSMTVFGNIVPILVGSNLEVIAGHGRLLAARQLGLTEVPTIPVEHLTPAQEKAFAVADNRLTEIATWDNHLLGETLRELNALDLDFSLEVTGFELPEIELLTETVTSRPDNDDEAPVPQPGPPVSRPDDLWLLGPHRMYCGSALDESAYRVLMSDDCAAAVFTDPPYNVRIDGHASGLGAIRHREFAMASGEMAPDAFTRFLGQTCTLLTRYSRDGSIHYICMVLPICTSFSTPRSRFIRN